MKKPLVVRKSWRDYPERYQTQVRLSEIFFSLQGETSSMGYPTVFIRLTGCPLRCSYCDTAYAFTGGKHQSIAAIMAHVQSFPAHYVTVTGGEPLAQPGVYPLLEALVEKDYRISLETSGAIATSQVPEAVRVILDIKTPGSDEDARMDWANIDRLRAQDEVKFVITSRADFDWALEKTQHYALLERCEVLFSPSYGAVPYDELASWVIGCGLPIRMQVQLHKVIWGERTGV